MSAKEILDRLKEISKYGDDGKQHTRFFNQFEAKSLLDYINFLHTLLFKKEEDIERLEDTIIKIKKYCRKNKIIDKLELQCIIRVAEVERQCDIIKDLEL